MHRARRVSEDPDAIERRQRLQQQIEEGVAEAVDRLREVARGREVFKSDHELRACIAMARMARLIIVKFTPTPARSIAHPDNSPEENERLLLSLEKAPNGPPDRTGPVEKYWLETEAKSVV